MCVCLCVCRHILGAPIMFWLLIRLYAILKFVLFPIQFIISLSISTKYLLKLALELYLFHSPVSKNWHLCNLSLHLFSYLKIFKLFNDININLNLCNNFCSIYLWLFYSLNSIVDGIYHDIIFHVDLKM